MIGILTAVREELKPILKKMPQVDVESAGGVLFFRGAIGGKQVVAARSGMGGERAGAAASAMLERFRPDSILATGFAGGLSAELVAGDLVVATRVGASRVPDAALLAAAEQTHVSNVRIHRGAVVSVDHVVFTAAEKREMAVRLADCAAVDMESAAIADEAARAGVPWLAVRAVTDGVEDSLPEMVEPFGGRPCLDMGTGEVIPVRMAALVVFCPRIVPQLVRLGKRAGLAARNLADFVESYTEHL